MTGTKAPLSARYSRSPSRRSRERPRRKHVLPHREAIRLRRLAATAQQNGQREICGLLVCGPDLVLSVLLTPNATNAPGSWEIPTATVREVRRLLTRTSLQVVGTFHSHPISPAVAGKSDLSRATLGSLMLIYDVCGREMKLWRVERAVKGRRAALVDMAQGPRHGEG